MACYKWMLLALLIPAGLLAQDTLWVARIKAPDRTVQMVFVRPFGVQYDLEGRMTVTCGALVRDSLGRVDTLASAARIIGADTSRVEIRFTTVDSLPALWGRVPYRLGADGTFEALE